MRQPWKAVLAALLAAGLNAPAAAACLAFQDRASCCGASCPMDDGGPAACCSADARESVPVAPPSSSGQVLPSSSPTLFAPAPVILVVFASPPARPSLEASASHSGLSPPAA